MDDINGRLVLIDEARRKLIEAQSLPEVKNIRDKTAALIDYFKRQKDVSHETVPAAMKTKPMIASSFWLM